MKIGKSGYRYQYLWLVCLLFQDTRIQMDSYILDVRKWCVLNYLSNIKRILSGNKRKITKKYTRK